MPPTIEELLEEMSGLLDTASTENRDLSEEELQRAEEIDGQIESRNRSDSVRQRHQELQADVPVDPLTATNVEVDETLERAFDHYMRTGEQNSDLVELRAQSEGTASEGGYLVPEGFRQKIVDRMVAFGGIGNVVETITTTTGNPLPWPTVDDTSNVGEIVAENGTFSAGADIVFGSASLGSYKYMAGGGSNLPLRVSVELLQDAAFDVQGLVSRKLGERIARIQSQHLVRGTGVAEPQGITTGLTGVELLDDTAGITYDDLVNFIHAVDPAYRAGARWAFNDATLAIIKKIKDSNGDPIWRTDSDDMGTALGGGMLMGYPVTIDQAFADLDVDNDSVNWGVFGNLPEGYVVRRVRDITLIVNPWNRAAFGQVEFTAWARMDSVQQNTNAYVALTGETP